MKRFIAGASCPKCSTSDSLYFEVKNKDEVFCSRCDYQDQRSQNLDKESVDNKDIEQHKDQEETRVVNIEKNIKWH